MVAGSSALLLLNGAAAAIGPLLAGALMSWFGPRAYFTTLATLTGSLLIYDVWRKSRRAAVKPSDKSPFVGAQTRGVIIVALLRSLAYTQMSILTSRTIQWPPTNCKCPSHWRRTI